MSKTTSWHRWLTRSATSASLPSQCSIIPWQWRWATSWWELIKLSMNTTYEVMSLPQSSWHCSKVIRFRKSDLVPSWIKSRGIWRIPFLNFMSQKRSVFLFLNLIPASLSSVTQCINSCLRNFDYLQHNYVTISSQETSSENINAMKATIIFAHELAASSWLASSSFSLMEITQILKWFWWFLLPFLQRMQNLFWKFYSWWGSRSCCCSRFYRFYELDSD